LRRSNTYTDADGYPEAYRKPNPDTRSNAYANTDSYTAAHAPGTI